MALKHNCEHPVNGSACGKPANVVIKVQQGVLLQDTNYGIGRGVGSRWMPICESHAGEYPDYDGFAIKENN